MLGPFVYVLVSLHPFFNVQSSLAYEEDSAWFKGCVDSSDSSFLRVFTPVSERDLDPVTCSERCLDEGYQVAALTLDRCYCGNEQQLGCLVDSECFNASSRERSESLLHLPVGGEQGTATLYRSEGPFLHNISVSPVADRVHAGKNFAVEVSGNLAGRPNQPTGTVSEEEQDFSYVVVEFLDSTPKGQSSHRVNLSDDGSFVSSSDWIFETPGKYEINISVSNLVSTLSSTLHLSVLQSSSPDDLVVSVLHGQLGVPSCLHLQQKVERAVYLGDPVTLLADLGKGLATEFCWWFNTEKREREETKETVCFHISACSNSTLKWTFETEGVHTVSVNASSTDGWIQQTLHVVVVRPHVSDLKVRVSKNRLTAGESVGVEVKLFTTMRQLLILNLTLNIDNDNNSVVLSSCKEKDINACGGNNSRSASGSDMKNNICNDDNCNYSNINSDRTPHQHHSNIFCHDGIQSYPHHFIPLHLVHTSNQSGCRLHLHLQCKTITKAGQYHITASLFSTFDPSTLLLSTILPQALIVDEEICTLRPSANWTSVVATHREFILKVVGNSGCTESRINWMFILGNTVVINKTTEEWIINVHLQSAGNYNVTVKAFNPVSCSSFQTHILAQDVVGELVLNVPDAIGTNRKQPAVFSVTAGSNMTVSLLVNASLLYRNSSYATGEEETVVLLCDHTGTVVVELRAENRVSSQNKSVSLHVEGNRKLWPRVKVNPNWQPPTNQSPPHSRVHSVQIYAAKQVYPTNTDVTFQIMADVPEHVEFVWYFGDSTSTRTTSRTVIKRYHRPSRFDVIVVMSAGRTAVTSDVFPLVIQRAVKLNKLVHPTSVLQNQTVTVSCRVNAGTNLTFLWSFGDGSSPRLGQSTEQHVFHRTGEFRVDVTVFNLVSSASLSSHVFVVDRPCQPPPVKNMGPVKLQVRRYEVVHLGVTYETDIDCDISGDLRYTWMLFDSAGKIFHLPHVDTHRQSLTLQSHVLNYDTYTAIAKVQVVGSLVYSNYSVRVQVMPSPPVAFIQGGTNVFINNRNTTVLTLDGQRSYDPDFPMNQLSYSWTCKPLSSIATSCFNQHIHISSPVLTLPVSLLKHNFDQFQLMLTVHSGERSASSEIFLTVKPNLPRKVQVYCPHCQGDQVSWDQSFSVSASCEDCDLFLDHIWYSWSLYLVNASTRPVTDVPFCYTVNLSAPSSIAKGPASSLQTPDTDTSLHTHSAPASVLQTEIVSKTRARKQSLGPIESGTSSEKSTDMSNKDESEPSSISAPFSRTAAGSGEGAFYLPLGKSDPPEHHPSTEYPPLTPDNSEVLYSQPLGHSDVISEFPVQSGSSADWEFSSLPVLEGGDVGGRADSDYDVPFLNAEEGDPGVSAGRPTGVDSETFSPSGDDSLFDPAVLEDEGSNLVVPRPSVVTREPTLLDLPRDPVDGRVFESYTYTGITSSELTFRPFSLRPGSRYLLEVTARSRNSFVGRNQLFLQIKPAPTGVMCQVQPLRGTELHTHFSIFCTSGKEDLLYKHSFSVGGRPPRLLYQGRDFQYYFSLPAGDPSDDYKVTIYTEIRSSIYGTATKPCPVSVQVQPSFHRDTLHRHPGLDLSVSGLKNLTALLRLGNSREIHNYVGLLSSILNRLSLDTEVDAGELRRIRRVLICTVCDLESNGQVSVVDSISSLKELLQVTNQVTLASAKQLIVYVQTISDLVLESNTPVRHHQDRKIPDTLVALLSYILQAVVSNQDFTPEMRKVTKITPELELDSGENIRKITSNNGCIAAASGHMEQGGSFSPQQMAVNIMQTASDLIMRYILLHRVQEHRVNTNLITLYGTYQNQTNTVISTGSTTFYIPASLIQLFVGRSGETEGRSRQPCVLNVLTEFVHNPYIHANYPSQLRGPMVDLSLYKCSVKRKIPVRSLVLPIIAELQHPPRNKSSAPEYILHRVQVNYHSFNITQEHLQQAIQLSVVFTPTHNKVFPIVLLFRMFEKPTPSIHHLHRIHRWESNTIHITLPPSYLNAAGVAHLALLNADLGKAARHRHLSEQIGYGFTVVSSLCLSWNDHQGAWTRHGCRTQQVDTTTAVNCSCHQLRPLTVVQHQIQSIHDTADLDPSLSVPHNLTVLWVLVLCVCLYVLGLVVCKKADGISEKNQQVHYLSDNSPFDPCLYTVTVHTGFCSAASMSAKVYIVLYGDNGSSHTRELHVPGCTLFRRNSQDTFILSAANCLGSVWGVHIWHDSSGPSANWYLKQVEVSEVNGRTWLFLGQCWLAVDKGDGQVETLLRVCTNAIGFTKMLCLRLPQYLTDFHMWTSVYSCPRPNLFTHTQRLSVCLLLLLGHVCVNTVLISHMDDQMPFEFGILDVSAVSVTTGLLSVVAVLPGATLISLLFRLQKLKLTRSGVQSAKGRKTEKDCFEDALSVNGNVFSFSWGSLEQWIREAEKKKYQGTDLLSRSTTIVETKNTDKEPVIESDFIIEKEDDTNPILQKNADQTCQRKEFDLLKESNKFIGTQSDLLSGVRDEDRAVHKEKDAQRKCSLDFTGAICQWCQCLAWVLCLLLFSSCLVLTAVMGMRFSSSKVLLWIHSLFFSLVFCIFFIQPLMIFIVAVTVSLWYRKSPDFHTFTRIKTSEIKAAKLCSHRAAHRQQEQLRHSTYSQEKGSYFEKMIAARQRARYLRFVRPPSPMELRKTRGRKRKETLICDSLRDLFTCVFMLVLMLCVTYGSSLTDHHHLNKAVRKQFISRTDGNGFMSIQKHEDWWRWTQTTLLNLLYKNKSINIESHILIGEPALWKTEMLCSIQDQVSSVTPACLHLFLRQTRTSTYPRSNVTVALVTPSRTCGHHGCHSESSSAVGLGCTKSDAESKLNLLNSRGWLSRQTVALKVQFTLFSPAPNLFTSVTLLTEQSPTGLLSPSSKVQSVRVHRAPAVWDYVVMVCQLFFLVLSLLQLCHQLCMMSKQGLMGYWRTPCNWLEVALLTVTIVHHVYYIYHSIIIMDAVQLLQRNRGHVDVSSLASWEQDVRTLRGVTLFLLSMKCVTVLRVNRTLAAAATLLTQSLCSLLWPTISGLILLVALSCAGNLLSAQMSCSFSSIPRSLMSLLGLFWGLRPTRRLLFLSTRDSLYYRVLYLSFILVLTTMFTGIMTSLVRRAKRSQSNRDIFTLTEISSYIKRRTSEFTGWRKPTWMESNKSKNYYLEEFESLVDELLFRLNTLSNFLYHTHHTEVESPITSTTQELFRMDTKDVIRTQLSEETTVNDHTDISGRKDRSHLIRSKLEPEMLTFLHKNNSSSDVILMSDTQQQQPRKRIEETPHGREIQTSLLESHSLIRIWTEDVVEKQTDQWTTTNNISRFNKTQATHTEVVVEVLVHEEPHEQHEDSSNWDSTNE